MRFALSLLLAISLLTVAQADDFIPRRQTKPPGPPLSPQEAMAKMTVPPGFNVELVASEPDIVNPVAMAFDERGRVWITESFEYPRREAGPGRDRVKVLEDTDGDGTMDKVTIFAEGLNIPSGIAVGHGGVWVANSPDILFLQDTDGDGKADKREVVVTGFGRDDTHELPNSLTWGPDGYLYGLNGVFNHSHVVQNGKKFDFTCALFRIHPRTREFELFCEGTSNPWGVAWDGEGSAFISACVIDHLWHLTESGYYHRQGGPYPPFTWKLDSIVKHKHQEAAYCGIHYYDSEAYPAKYRQKLYMGNIHGTCVNSDKLQRDGATYFATPEPDFLSGNDAWFMPVAQKTGPDGCLWVLDWYDRYHCYQDANRDPKGIDRLKGRLYRVRYEHTPRAEKFDLAQETDEQLVARLGSGNGLFRELAQRLLTERLMADASATSATRDALEALVFSDSARTQRMHALWSLVSAGPHDAAFHAKLLAADDSVLRSWGVRAAGNYKQVNDALREQIAALAHDKSPDVRLQVAIAARKIEGLKPLPVLLQVLANSGEDKLIPHIVWQNLYPLLEKQSGEFVQLATSKEFAASPAVAAILPRAIDRILAVKGVDPATIATIFTLVLQDAKVDPAAAKSCLAILATRVQSREINGRQLATLRERLQEPLAKVLQNDRSPLFLDAALVATTWKDERAIGAVRSLLSDRKRSDQQRLAALDALIAAGDDSLLMEVGKLLDDRQNSVALRGAVLSSLSRVENPLLGSAIVAIYPKLEPELQPRAIELLTQRATWSQQLVAEIGRGKIPPDALNVNQVRKLLSLGDSELSAAVAKYWGTIRTDRDPQREMFVASMKTLIHNTKGDATRGQVVFSKICGQCHKMYGQGQEVGPDITLNGRSSFDQLVSNVFDPSLVIGASYQARTVLTTDGRVLAGLLVEDNPQRVVLKQQGGKLETIAREDVDQIKVSTLSLMPEGIEKQLKPQEIADLFAYITLDKPPSDPAAKLIPGAGK
jgi:putative heme-binding domain-containing protein